MSVMMVAAALAASVGEEAHDRVEAFGPHVAYYDKASTQEPALEVHFRGQGEAAARALSPAGVFMVSVDPTHVRIRVDASTCARVDARALLEETQALGAGGDDEAGAPTPRLIYRGTADGNVDLGTAFLGVPSPVLFSWHADLDDPDATVEADKKAWTARTASSEWTVARKTGVLQRLTVGEDALVLDRVEAGKKVQPMAAAEVCAASTSEGMQRQLSTQLRIRAFPASFLSLSRQWEDLDEAARQDAARRYQSWWERFFADELPTWAEGVSDGPWRAQLLRDLVDLEAYGRFVDGLSPEDRPRAVALWKLAWFDRLGQALLSQHLREIVSRVGEGIDPGQRPAPEVEQALLLAPIEAAILARAEATIQQLLVPSLEEGGATLERLVEAQAGDRAR